MIHPEQNTTPENATPIMVATGNALFLLWIHPKLDSAGISTFFQMQCSVNTVGCRLRPRTEELSTIGLLGKMITVPTAPQIDTYHSQHASGFPDLVASFKSTLFGRKSMMMIS